MVFIQLVNVVNHTDGFAGIEESLHTWDSSQVHKDGSIYANQSMSYTTLTKEKSKHT